jgi:MoaA/NifB/PqqE/SkfB family radical SAM enzyme
MMQNVLDGMHNQIKTINLTGTYGESSLHPQFFEFLHMIADACSHKVKLMMETNGCTNNTDWWREFGKVVKERFREDSFVVFALDGTDNETHQKYRRGLSFEKIIENAKAFSENAQAIWQMIEFEHNAHQFDEAKKMAASFGWQFKKRRSRLRFVSIKDGQVIADKQGYHSDETKRKKYSIESISVATKDKNTATAVHKKVSSDYQDTTEIVCEWKKRNQVSIDYDGTVWQCCYFSTFNHPTFHLNELKSVTVDQQILNTMTKERLSWYEDQYDFDWNNLNKHSLKDILNHRFFTHDLPKSFEGTTKDKEYPRIQRCSKFCGSASREIESKINVES